MNTLNKSFGRLLTKEEEKWAVNNIRTKNGRDLLARGHLKLVNSLAHTYWVKINKAIDFETLVAAGNIGLCYALNTFNKKKNCKFSTHAFMSIRRRILEVCESINYNIEHIGGTHYMRVHVHGKGALKLEALRHKLGRAVRVDEYVNVLSNCERAKVRGLIRVPLSRVVCPKTLIDAVVYKHKRDLLYLNDVLDRLNPEMKKVLVYFFVDGLNNREVAKKLSISRTRAYDLRKQALLVFKFVITK